MMLRRRGLLMLFATPLLGETSAPVFAVLTSMASSLSEGNPAGFLKYLDHGMATYSRIEANVNSLTSQCEIVCSLDVLTEQLDGDKDLVDLDWFMQLRSKAEDGPLERRRELVKAELRKQGKHWKVVSLEPNEVLAPLKI